MFEKKHFHVLKTAENEICALKDTKLVCAEDEETKRQRDKETRPPI